jgi:Tfp pilus assembly protein FimT
MMVICTVLAIASPSLRGFFTSRQTADTAAQICALTQLARSLAVTNGLTYRLEGSYQLLVQKVGAFEDLGTEYGRVFRLPEGTSVTVEDTVEGEETNSIDFDPDGHTEATAIRLTDRRGAEIEIVCPSPTELFHVATDGEGQFG